MRAGAIARGRANVRSNARARRVGGVDVGARDDAEVLARDKG